MSKKTKFYVVWNGLNPGIYRTWNECQSQIKGVKGAAYKSFNTKEEAERAYASPAYTYLKKGEKATAPSFTPDSLPPIVKRHALAVDAACSGNPGPMEYRGVYLGDGTEVFHFGPVHGTNNIGEFLAIVHALAMLDKKGLQMTIYSDSRTAISWVRKKCCKTQLAQTADTEPLYDLIDRAETWLNTHTINVPILKWETDQWGEIPADFGRK